MVLSSSTDMPSVVEPAICAEMLPTATTNITPISTAVTVLRMSTLLAFRMSDGRGHERAPWHRRPIVRPPLLPINHFTPIDCPPATPGKFIREKDERDISVITRPAANHFGAKCVIGLLRNLRDSPALPGSLILSQNERVAITAPACVEWLLARPALAPPR